MSYPAYRTAADYFRILTSCLLDTQITDEHGAHLSLDEGTHAAIALILKVGIHGKIMVIGNGGSAAIASHVQNDLCNSVKVKAMVLSETSLLTALTNDHGYVEAYARLVRLWVTSDDLLIAISSSGQSENILQAVRAATEQQCAVITFSGFKPENPLRQMGTLNFYVSSNQYGFVEVSHTAQLHFLTDMATLEWKIIESAQEAVSGNRHD